MKKRKIIIIIGAAVLLLSAIAVGVFFALRREEPKCDGVTHAWGEWSTVAEWEKISLGVKVFKCNTGTVHCTDGSVKIDN